MSLASTSASAEHADIGKRKREEEHLHPATRTRIHALSLDVSTPASGAVDSPLHSPASSSGQHAGTPANGVQSRRPSGKVARRRNIDRVHFGVYDIRTWYFSPYQFDDEEWAAMAAAPSNGASSAAAPTSAKPRGSTNGKDAASTLATPTIDALGVPKPGGALSSSADKAPALHATTNGASVDEPPAKAIWVCDGCFKYMRTYSGFRAHKRDCRTTHPPGRKVYQRGAHTIWEVDGAQAKLYAQNLSLFGKLFIDHKTIYFDVEPFVFYVLTDASSQFDHVLGYFSKEKLSYDDYNLACIITFPPFQKQGFGTLMIEFSYYLSSLTSVPGTPERPLSDLGLRGYLSFWSAVALRTLALLFNDQDADVQARLLPSAYAIGGSMRGRHHMQTAAAAAALAEERQQEECARLRRIVSGEHVGPLKKKHKQKEVRPVEEEQGEDGDQSAMSGRGDAGASTRGRRGGRPARRGGLKGWDGEVPKRRPRDGSINSGPRHSDAPSDEMADSSLEVGAADSEHGNDGAAAADGRPEGVQHADINLLVTTLSRLAEATNLRIDDLSLALAECDMLLLRNEESASAHKEERGTGNQDTADDGGLQLVITLDRVRDAIKRRNVKRPVLDVNYVLI